MRGFNKLSDCTVFSKKTFTSVCLFPDEIAVKFLSGNNCLKLGDSFQRNEQCVRLLSLGKDQSRQGLALMTAPIRELVSKMSFFVVLVMRGFG